MNATTSERTGTEHDGARQAATFFFAPKYRDAGKAYRWVADAFGFEPGDIHTGEGERVVHAEMYVGSADSPHQPADDAASGPGVYAVVADGDIDAHYARAQAAGAGMVRPFQDTGYSSREYTALDFEGNPWSFGTYGPDRPEATA